MTKYGPQQIIAMANAQGIFLREKANKTPYIEITSVHFDFMVLDRFARLMEEMFKINFVTDEENGRGSWTEYHHVKFLDRQIKTWDDWDLQNTVEEIKNPIDWDQVNEALNAYEEDMASQIREE